MASVQNQTTGQKRHRMLVAAEEALNKRAKTTVSGRKQWAIKTRMRPCGLICKKNPKFGTCQCFTASSILNCHVNLLEMRWYRVHSRLLNCPRSFFRLHLVEHYQTRLGYFAHDNMKASPIDFTVADQETLQQACQSFQKCMDQRLQTKSELYCLLLCLRSNSSNAPWCFYSDLRFLLCSFLIPMQNY